jgi:hypothetical protein
MIKDRHYWEAWEAQGPLREPVNFQQNLRLFQAMYDWARKLGALPPADPLAGLETKIRVARILNHVRGPAGTDRSGT